MDIVSTKNLKAILQAWAQGSRRILLEGGTSSSKTYSALQALILIARKATKPLQISVVSESLPHLKRGCIRDLFNILGESPDTYPGWSKTESTLTIGPVKVEFFGADQADKVRGPRRDILFINEGNNVPWETAQGLDIRTSTFTIVDWNPTSEFWAHEFWKGQPGNDYCHSTYLDAKEVLPEQVVADIESYRDTDPNWWNIYGLGLLGKVTGLVYPFFDLIDKLPDGGDTFYGLDWGYAHDPSVLVRSKIMGWNLYSEELLYEPFLTNDDIAARFDQLQIKRNYDEIWADPDEPKSIEEIHRYGFNIKPSPKVKGIEEYGHQKVREFKQFWTKSSVNCIKEQRNFMYVKDKDGVLTNKTTHTWSHGMRARAYGVTGKLDTLGGGGVVITRHR